MMNLILVSMKIAILIPKCTKFPTKKIHIIFSDETIHGWHSIKFGGPRLMTFMVYLSSIEAGGHTIFPQPGISVKPEQGSALYWFNMGPQNNYDSRIYHLGCPVLYGNKWIANKWIKLVPNYQNYPCYVNDSHYSVMNYSIIPKK